MVEGIKSIFKNVIFLLVFSSCNNLLPTGFWNSYQKKFLVKNISPQGTNGGYRAMHWKVGKRGFFNSEEVNAFAVENGWKLVDSLDVQADELKTWYYNNAPIFPLSYSGFSSTPSKNFSEFENFPRWINGQFKIYQFKTGWLAYEPGTDNALEVNGFVLLNQERNEMSVYHLWGD